MKKSPANGSTLVEVLIVLAIVGILAALAYPSYVEPVRRGHRAEARTALLEAAQYMQRFYAANDRYDEDRTGGDIELPDAFAKVPTGDAPRYLIKLDSVSRTAFTLKADPESASAKEDSCGSLTLTNTGVRGVSTAKTVAECWR